MKYIIILCAVLSSCSCIQNSTETELVQSGRIIVIPTDNYVDGRQTFSVLVDGYAMDYMFPEEIANSLITGEWDYNEDLRVQ